eukprot:Opistho-2@26920
MSTGEEFELQPTGTGSGSVRRPSYMVALDQPLALVSRIDNLTLGAGVRDSSHSIHSTHSAYAPLPTILETMSSDPTDVDKQIRLLVDALTGHRRTSNGANEGGQSNGDAGKSASNAVPLIESISSWSCRTDDVFSKCVRSINGNEALIAAVMENLNNPVGELNGAIYRWFFEWYKLRSKDGSRFVLQFLPLILWNYLSGVAHNDSKVMDKAEACLLAIYNTEAINADGTSIPAKMYTPQSLLRPSVYHEATGPSLTLTETALAQHESAQQPVVVRRQLHSLTRIAPTERATVISFVLSRLNACLNTLPDASLEAMCRVYERIVSAGCPFGIERPVPSVPSDFPNGDFPQLSQHPRISLDSRTLQEMLVGIYQCVHAASRSVSAAAILALERLHDRASHELIIEVTLVTEAIRHSIALDAGREAAANRQGPQPLFEDVSLDSIDF